MRYTFSLSVTFPTSPDLQSRLYNERIGYIGTDSTVRLINASAAKKAGVEDGRNQ